MRQDGTHIYYQNDSHLNDYGQQKLAEFLIENIQAQSIN